MNALAYRINDLYLSVTLFYGGILMASNMVWAHEIIHYLSIGHFNKYTRKRNNSNEINFINDNLMQLYL